MKPFDVQEARERAKNVVERYVEALENLSREFVGRSQVISLLGLAAVSGENLLLVGDPGTAKTAIIRRFAELFDGRFFSYLLTRFTEPAELFGPLDVKAFRDNSEYKIQPEGMLPEADIAFLDEVFEASSPILNSLLSILNERSFSFGKTKFQIPLLTLIGATNSIPENLDRTPFADRFLLRSELENCRLYQLEQLLEAGWEIDNSYLLNRLPFCVQREGEVPRPIRIDELRLLTGLTTQVDLSSVRPHIAEIGRVLRTNGVSLSDRRVVKFQRIVSTASVLAGRSEAIEEDLWPIAFTYSRSDEAMLYRNAVAAFCSTDKFSESSRTAEQIVSDLSELNARVTAKASEQGLLILSQQLAQLHEESMELSEPGKSKLSKQINKVIAHVIDRLEHVEYR